MSATQGLPTQGTDVTVVITRVHLHPHCTLVEFWGTFDHEQITKYQSLAKDIQFPLKSFHDFEGSPGDHCMVQIDGTWYRSRIVSRNGSNYNVFLIDKGMTYETTSRMLAWGKKEHFHLPPEVEFCVLANVLPLQPENRWSPVALQFLKSLQGKTLMAHVQNVLIAQRTVLLHIPFISKQMYEMGFAKKLDSDVFHDFVLRTLQYHTAPEISSSPQQSEQLGEEDQLHRQENYMYPELLAGAVETVIVTEMTNPQRIFCQLKVFSHELKKISEQIALCHRDKAGNCLVRPELIGFPCAVRGSDGKWYRSVLQQVFPDNMVEVLNVDYGTKLLVQMSNVRPLAAEFLRMPVVTYMCSLHGIIDKGVGWTASQIEFLKTHLLHKTVIARFEYKSISEGVYYVTLYGDENTNINNLFRSKESLLRCENTPRDYAIQFTCQHDSQQKTNERGILASGQAERQNGEKERAKKLPSENLSMNSSHVAFVQHASNPSEFWIQTENYTNKLDELHDGINHLYQGSEYDVVKNPTLGLYCAAKATDGYFYRATIAHVSETKIKVFFVDYGDTKEVDKSNVRILPEKFQELPLLALKCTLAGIRPKGLEWSRDATEAFLKAVSNRVLNVHVVAKYNDSYIVKLTDIEAPGEGDIGNLLCKSGFAERDDTQKQAKARTTIHPTTISATQHSGFASVHSVHGLSFQTQNDIGPSSSEKQMVAFKETMFSTGTVLDVVVSYIESPNDFWCQVLQNNGLLKLLMRDMQAHYECSSFQSLEERACVARHPHNRMWYRALVIQKHETPQVDILFVDYGHTETISIYDVRRINPEFLHLPAQAFRCSLLNPVNPTSAVNDWSEEATTRFHDFVKTATCNFVILKCTVYAVMYSEQKIVFNIVDLETPFESVCTTVMNLQKSAPPIKSSGPSFRLDTYYYSTHNVKTGTEEEVKVTSVNSVAQFYCQLERNADVIEKLKKKVNSLCCQLQNAKLPAVCGTLCFAKFTDGVWYRGQIKAMKPSILVHFVDYGDTIEVDKSDLLPVPREASDIMSVPVQAVVCCLSDFPPDPPTEVNNWLRSTTECKFRALIVGRDTDGKLLVELYSGNTQINSKIKKIFKMEMQTEKGVIHQTVHPAQKHSMEAQCHTQAIRSSNPKPAFPMRYDTKPADKHPKPPQNKSRSHNGVQRPRTGPLELYTPPHQRRLCENEHNTKANGTEPNGALIKPREVSLPSEAGKCSSASTGTESQKGSTSAAHKIQKLPQIADLPAKSITSGMVADVYISHFHSPLSFYVQFVSEEAEIFSLVEKLNDLQSNPQTTVTEVAQGDLVVAEFAEDFSWYRAVVREVDSDEVALVEFVDFGNTAKMPFSKMGRLKNSFVQLPLYSVHCMLSDAAALKKEGMIDSERISSFEINTGAIAEKKFKCRFITLVGSVWEVCLEDNGTEVKCRAPSKCLNSVSEITQENCEDVKLTQNVQNSELSACSPHYFQQDLQEGQKLEVFVTSVNDAMTFWCQCTDSEELDKITLCVSKVEDVADYKQNESLSPGSPCIALYAEDQLWYRGEVLDNNANELSVHFIDYGNQSQVQVTDVREIPHELLQIPPQAFLCRLENFDISDGSWGDGAVDKLISLTSEKVFQLTLLKVSRKDGTIECVVQLEGDGLVINEAMKSWWTKNKSQGDERLCETPLSCDSAGKGSKLSEHETSECPKTQDTESPAACADIERDSLTEQNKSPDLDASKEALRLTSTPRNDEFSEESLSSAFAVFAHKENDQNSSECNTTSEDQMITEGMREKSCEEVNVVLTMATPKLKPNGASQCDSGVEDTTFPSSVDNDEQMISTLSESKDQNMLKTYSVSEESGASVVDAIGKDESIEETPQGESQDESDTLMTGSKSTDEEMTHSSDITLHSVSIEDGDDHSVAIISHKSIGSVTSAKMVQKESIQPSCVHLARQLPNEQKTEADDGIPQEELSLQMSFSKNDLTTDVETLADYTTVDEITADLEDACSDLPAEKVDSTFLSTDMGGMHENMASCVEEVCLTVPKEPSDDDDASSLRDDCLGGVTEELTFCITVSQDPGAAETDTDSPIPIELLIDVPSEDQTHDGSFYRRRDEAGTATPSEDNLREEETSLPPEDELPGRSSDTESQTHHSVSPERSELVDEVTYLLGEITLVDSSRDEVAPPEHALATEAEREEGEQQVNMPPKQDEEVNDGAEGMATSEGILDTLLSEVIHLSLVINDGSLDT